MGIRRPAWVFRVAPSAPIAWGCVAFFALAMPAASEEPVSKTAPRPVAPTYTKDVQPILQKKCQNCHRRDQVGPFALETYEQARKRAADIASVVGDRSMPPWKPKFGFGPKLKHDPSLTHAEIAVLHAWAAAEAPKGDHRPAAAAAAPEAGAWALGKPDLVLEMTEEFVVPAGGPDIYRCFVIPSKLPHDVYVSAVEYQPGNRRAVHHVMAFLDLQGAGRVRDEADPGPGYSSYSGAGVEVDGDLGGFAAGNQVSHLPDGVGRLVHREADVILQVHYHPTGKAEVDRTRLGLYLCRKPVQQTVHWANANNDKFRLQPGKSNIEVKASWYVPVDVEALGVTPHMHQLGRDFRMTATLPNGKIQDLVHIAEWDPSWQNTYYFEKRIDLPKGSTVNIVAHYDNSAHPRNPHSPPRLVTWGPEAADEMCVGYIGIVKKGQDLTTAGEKDDLYQILAQQYLRKVVRQQSARR
ncbi:MAG: hypothetical protein P4L85_13250 [Paludisphaera borealis]|uniref:monooxygenase n=1 Tax=Paludisphaera borealis TaxID=1387353 RepID=UPI00283E3CDD|nr:hypothetical protein [Paludisphaera borealis]MDR3620311.1 hypothetical protein [Paludisphaera borealis]